MTRKSPCTCKEKYWKWKVIQKSLCIHKPYEANVSCVTASHLCHLGLVYAQGRLNLFPSSTGGSSPWEVPTRFPTFLPAGGHGFVNYPVVIIHSW